MHTEAVNVLQRHFRSRLARTALASLFLFDEWLLLLGFFQYDAVVGVTHTLAF
jgi:hypothetical protein